MGLKVTKAHKLGGMAWEVRSAQPVSLQPHARCSASVSTPLTPQRPPCLVAQAPPLRNVSHVSSQLACVGLLLLVAASPLLGPFFPCGPTTFSICSRSSPFFPSPLPGSSSWMHHHHRAPFSPHAKWASRVIELENATIRRGSSLCHLAQFVSASAAVPWPTMPMLEYSNTCCYNPSAVLWIVTSSCLAGLPAPDGNSTPHYPRA